jgi:preprotein translocase subunit YajC
LNNLAGLLPFVLIILVFWFLILRPQRRRQQTVAQTQRALTVGTEVVLTSGIYGMVASLDDQTLGLELAPGTVVKVARQAVVRVLEPEPGTGGLDGPTGPQGLYGGDGLHDTDSDDPRP